MKSEQPPDWRDALSALWIILVLAVNARMMIEFLRLLGF